jgi:Aldo/keto reductase family
VVAACFRYDTLEFSKCFLFTLVSPSPPPPKRVGVLTGKYNNGTIPPNARLAIQDHPVMNRLRAGFFSDEGRRKVEKVKLLVVSDKDIAGDHCDINGNMASFCGFFFIVQRIAQKLKITPAQLSIAWCLKNPRVSSVITGASKPSQVEENVQAIRYVHLLTDEVMSEIETVLGNRPDPAFNFRHS